MTGNDENPESAKHRPHCAINVSVFIADISGYAFSANRLHLL